MAAYKAFISFRAKSPCCQKVYTCRLCHDDKEMSHEIDRRKVQELKCLKCGTQQPVQESCKKCETVFGKYFCTICRLFDDVDKQQFHCEPCGICRVGGRDNFFHCTKCNMCLGISLKDEHKCVENTSHSNCAVCMEDLHTSRTPLQVPSCGHLIHRSCYQALLEKGMYACPSCNQSTLDMKQVWKELDEEIATTPMPEEYRNMHIQILCRDCHTESSVLFHVLGAKCQQCGSYNTCRTAAHEEEEGEHGAANQSAPSAEGATESEDQDGSSATQSSPGAANQTDK